MNDTASPDLPPLPEPPDLPEIDLSATACVARGIARLDEVVPDWRDRLRRRLRELRYYSCDVGSSAHCPLAVLYGAPVVDWNSFERGWQWFLRWLPDNERGYYAFEDYPAGSLHGFEANSEATYDELNEAWRVALDGPATVVP